MEAAIKPTDDVITSYRAHGWTYMRGISVAGVLAELFGRELGCADGKEIGYNYNFTFLQVLLLPRGQSLAENRVALCTCILTTSTAVTVLSAPRCHLVPDSPGTSSTLVTTASLLPSMVTVPLHRVSFGLHAPFNLLCIGQLYEAYNLSKLWNLPAIFVCENNQYGMGTSVDRHSASTEFYKRAGYLPGILYSFVSFNYRSL